MIPFERFKNIIITELYMFVFDEVSLIDAYNHITLDTTKQKYSTNILGIRVWFNELWQITNTCFKFSVKTIPTTSYMKKNHHLETLMKTKGMI